MVVTISGIALFGVLSVVFWRMGRTSFTAALCVFLFGFLTASSGMAPAIRSVITTLSHLLD